MHSMFAFRSMGIKLKLPYEWIMKIYVYETIMVKKNVKENKLCDEVSPLAQLL